MNALNVVLRPLTISEKLFLSEANISEIEKIFEPHIDFDYKNWCLNERVKGISEIEMEIYEIVKDADFNNLFTSLSDNLDSLCLTKNQIINFCLKYPRHLIMEGPSNFFLTKKDFNKPAKAENLFVAHVYVYSDGLDINGYFHHFDNADILHSDYRHRVIVPKVE